MRAPARPPVRPGPAPASSSFTGALEDLNKVGVVTTSHPVDTTDANNNITTPQVTASVPIIVTTTLPDGARLRPYSALVEETGATAPFAFTVTTGALPPGSDAQRRRRDHRHAHGVRHLHLRRPPHRQQRAHRDSHADDSRLRAGRDRDGDGARRRRESGLHDHAFGDGRLRAVHVVGGRQRRAADRRHVEPRRRPLGHADAVGHVHVHRDRHRLGGAAAGRLRPITLNVTPAANAQSRTLAEDTATPITLTGTGAAASAFTFAIGSQPLHGTVSLAGAIATYTPASNYNGADSFTFRVSQGSLTSAFATVSLTITAVNDAPTANPQTVITNVSTAKAITLTGTDPEGSALTYAIVTNPAHGSISGGTGAARTYTPTNGFQGQDTFTFRVNDGSLNSAAATVTIEVGPPLSTWADVMVTLTDAPDPVALGSNVVYTAAVHNNGPASATGTTLTLPYSAADFTLVSAVAPAGGSCVTPGNPDRLHPRHAGQWRDGQRHGDAEGDQPRRRHGARPRRRSPPRRSTTTRRTASRRRRRRFPDRPCRRQTSR